MVSQEVERVNKEHIVTLLLALKFPLLTSRSASQLGRVPSSRWINGTGLAANRTWPSALSRSQVYASQNVKARSADPYPRSPVIQTARSLCEDLLCKMSRSHQQQ